MEITEVMIEAEKQFTEYFVKNYPGPDTIIHDPNWHAPRLFRRARQFIEAALSPAPVSAEPQPVAWVREGIFEELHKDGSHSGMQTVLWLDEENPGKRHAKRIPIFTSPPDLAAEIARLREALERIKSADIGYSVDECAGLADWAAFEAGLIKALTVLGDIARDALADQKGGAA